MAFDHLLTGAGLEILFVVAGLVHLLIIPSCQH